MGKGGPLAFLNKKTWHPARWQNQEEVWKRQQASAKEEQKLKDLQKQIAEERAKDEMNAIAEAAGVKSRSDRLDWMYQGGIAARQEADHRNTVTAASQQQPTIEDASAAAAAAAIPADAAELQGNRTGAAIPSFYAEDTPASANEMWQRLHTDPLFAIKQQEIAARKSIVTNPVQMDMIKKKVRDIKRSRKHDSDEEERREKRRERKEEKKRHKKEHSKKKRKDRHRSRSRSRSFSDDDRRQHHYSRREYSRYKDDDDNDHDHPRARQKGNRRHRDGPTNDTVNGTSNGGNGDNKKVYTDDASAQRGKDIVYGLSLAGHASNGIAKDRDERHHAARETQRRLEEAAKKREKETEEMAMAQQRYRRRDRYKSGQMSEEERKKKLEEMSAAAAQHEEERWTRVRQLDDKEAAEEAEQRARDKAARHRYLTDIAGNANAAASFLNAATKSVYGAGGDASLGDRIGRGKAFHQKDGGKAFGR